MHWIQTLMRLQPLERGNEITTSSTTNPRDTNRPFFIVGIGTIEMKLEHFLQTLSACLCLMIVFFFLHMKSGLHTNPQTITIKPAEVRKLMSDCNGVFSISQDEVDGVIVYSVRCDEI